MLLSQIIYYSNINKKMNIQKIQSQLSKIHPQLKQKKNIIQYYVSLQFPEKQRKLIHWWSSLIQDAIKISKQVYISPSDLQVIFTIHGLRPVPLKAILDKLAQSQKFQWRDRKTIDILNKQQSKNFMSSILRVIIPQKKISTRLTKHQSIQDAQSKIISINHLTQQLQEVKDIILQKLDKTKNIQYDFILKELKNQLDVSNQAIQFLIVELENKQWILIQSVNNKKVILFSQKLDDYKDKNWINAQKTKFLMKATMNIFSSKIQKKEQQEIKKMQQAKLLVRTNNKERARQILVQVKDIQKAKKNLQIRLGIVQNQLNQFQMNQINQITFDVISSSQQLLKKVSVDPQAFDAIKQKDSEIKMMQDQINMGFRQLNDKNMDDNIEDQVDNMMNQILQEVKSKKNKGRETISQKFVSNQKGDVQFLKYLQVL